MSRAWPGSFRSCGARPRAEASRYPRAMAKLDIGAEVSPKKTFVWAIDWPGWCRSGKDRELAIDAFLAARGRYAKVARHAGLDLPKVDADDLDVAETVDGGGGTEFGVPSSITKLDRRRTTKVDAERLASLVEAAWAIFDRVAERSPAELRKGPRGGGRDRDKMIDHVIGADHAYAHEIGLRGPEPSRADRGTVDAERSAVLEVLRQPSNGSPLADRRWTQRYAARRIAWHALDHAWEMEDRSEPAP
jgi:hypothetical protein